MKTKNPYLAIDKRILGDSGTSDEAAKCLDMLCNQIGTRFAGTDGYEKAAQFMLARFEAYKMDNVYLEPFKFTAWKRGKAARFSVLGKRKQSIHCYQLPYSGATVSGGLEAPLVNIAGGSSKEVKARGKKISGSVVLTDGSGGHRAEIYRRCAKAGAVGFVLSAKVKGGGCITGSVYGMKDPLPCISVPLEDGDKLRRKLKKGKVRVSLTTGGTFEKGITWNVIGELRGDWRPEELVIMGGHLDSHEISPGAMDNAAGAVAVMETARLLARQKKNLKRTVRFIGFAGEEIGLLGSKYHAKKHAAELSKARFMLNSDCPPMSRPKGLVFHKSREAEGYLKKLEREIQTPIVYKRNFHPHSDHYPFILKGVITAGTAGGKFGPGIQHYVHMAGDTPEKISVVDLREGAAFAARVLLRASNDANWLKG